MPAQAHLLGIPTSANVSTRDSPAVGANRENDYIAFDEYNNEPIGRSFGNCEIPFVTS